MYGVCLVCLLQNEIKDLKICYIIIMLFEVAMSTNLAQVNFGYVNLHICCIWNCISKFGICKSVHVVFSPYFAVNCKILEEGRVMDANENNT